MQTQTQFRKLPNGILARVISAYDIERVRAAEYAKTPEGKAEAREARKAERLDEARQRPIGIDSRAWGRQPQSAYRETERINAYISREMKNCSDAFDIGARTEKTVTREGVRVAAVEIFVIYQVSGQDYGLAEGETTEDGLTYLVYRDPSKPSKLVFEYR